MVVLVDALAMGCIQSSVCAAPEFTSATDYLQSQLETAVADGGVKSVERASAVVGSRRFAERSEFVVHRRSYAAQCSVETLESDNLLVRYDHRGVHVVDDVTCYATLQDLLADRSAGFVANYEGCYGIAPEVTRRESSMASPMLRSPMLGTRVQLRRDLLSTRLRTGLTTRGWGGGGNSAQRLRDSNVCASSSRVSERRLSDSHTGWRVGLPQSARRTSREESRRGWNACGSDEVRWNTRGEPEDSTELEHLPARGLRGASPDKFTPDKFRSRRI